MNRKLVFEYVGPSLAIFSSFVSLFFKHTFHSLDNFPPKLAFLFTVSLQYRSFLVDWKLDFSNNWPNPCLPGTTILTEIAWTMDDSLHREQSALSLTTQSSIHMQNYYKNRHNNDNTLEGCAGQFHIINFRIPNSPCITTAKGKRRLTDFYPTWSRAPSHWHARLASSQ